MMKKNKWYVLGMLATALVFSLFLAGCELDVEDSDGRSLTFDTWVYGELTADTAHWFKFTATAATQYIHIMADQSVNTQLYSSKDKAVGNAIRGTGYIREIVSTGKTYYVKVWPSSGSSGVTYYIAFNESTSGPSQ